MSEYNVTNQELRDALDIDPDEEGWGKYDSTSFLGHVQEVANAIHDVHLEKNLAHPLDFTWSGVLEDAVDGMMIEAPTASGIFLSVYCEDKHLTGDREATGFAQAEAIRDRLLYEHGRLVKYAQDNGLEGART